MLGTSRSAGPDVDGLTHLQLDMTGPGAAERAVDETVVRLGSLDVVVNNLGSGRLSRGFADESDAQWAEFFELNLMTAIRTTRAALPHLIQSGGVVVNVSSVNGHLPGPSIYSYSAGKAAMNNLTVGLSLEFARQGSALSVSLRGRSARRCGSAPRVSRRPSRRVPERIPRRSSTRRSRRYRSVGSRHQRKSAIWSHSLQASAPARLQGPRSASTAASRPACNNARSAFFAKHSITRAIRHRLLSPPATACDAHGVG